MTKTIRIHSCCACNGVFFIRFVVDDDKGDTNSIMLATNMVFIS